jgi:hypothetical protein
MRLAVENWHETAGWAIVDNDAEPDDEYRETGAGWYRLFACNFPSEQDARAWIKVFELASRSGTKMDWTDYYERYRCRWKRGRAFGL